MLKEILNKLRNRNEKYNEMSEDLKLQKKLINREKSSNEVELDGYLEKEREKLIKKQVQQFRKRDKNELWHGKQILSAPNIFKNQRNIFVDDYNILHAPNIFSRGGRR